MRALRYLSLGVLAVCLSSPLAAAAEHALAVTDAGALRELDLREHGAGDSFSLAALLGARSNVGSAEIFALPSMAALRTVLEREFRDYKPGDLQPFDRDALFANSTRFILAGVVNRMDRAFAAPEACGEIRLIYRPIANFGSGEKSARLPMTLNLIFNAKGSAACAEIARRWLALDGEAATGVALAEKLTSNDGALGTIAPGAIDRIETNIQIARASVNPDDFTARADYLIKVFKYDAAAKSFRESPMENQIDTPRLLTDAILKKEFNDWLLAPDHLIELDRGMIVIPEKFLATRAITATPAKESNVQGLVADTDVVAALAKASASTTFENLQSPAGFARRLNDSTCAGCHQTRAIGGFHFPGVDWSGDRPGLVAAFASPHFIGDQPRRRDILNAMSAEKAPDFSRGFSARPQARRSQNLVGTTYFNGWGASCYPHNADTSFSSWSCAEGLACRTPQGPLSATRAGLCFPKAD